MWEKGVFFKWVADECNIPNQNTEGIASRAVSSYWAGCAHLDFYGRLGFADGETAKCVPLYFHTDGVKIYKAQKAWVYSYSSACRKGPSMKTKLLSILVRDALVAKHKTHDEIGKLHGYITDTLRSGCFPHRDPQGQKWPRRGPEHKKAGEKFCGGWILSFSGFKADWEGRVVVHKLIRNYSCTFICEHCPASRRPNFCFGDFREEAPHRQVHFTHEQFLMMNPDSKQSTWTTVRGWTKDRNLEETRLRVK